MLCCIVLTDTVICGMYIYIVVVVVVAAIVVAYPMPACWMLDVECCYRIGLSFRGFVLSN